MRIDLVVPASDDVACCSILIVGLSGGRLRGVQAPLGLEGLVNLLGVAELQVADLLGNDCALMLRLEGRNQPGLETASLLWVEIADLLRNIEKRGNSLVMALLRALSGDTASTADLNWELLTAGVSNKLARLLLNILGGAGRLVDSLANLWALAIALLDQRPVAFLDLLLDGLLLESDLAGLLKVLLADLLLSRVELCDVSVVALFHVLVCALKDGVLLQSCDSLLSLDTAKTGFRVS